MTTLPPDIDASPRKRSRAWLVAMVAGLALVALAVVALLALFVRTIDGYQNWPEGAAVPQDGARHVVDVDPDETFYLWLYGIYDDADCTATDVRSGDAVPLREPSSALTRSGGAVSYVARLSGKSTSGQIAVTCAAVAGEIVAPVYVDALNGPAVVDDLGPKWPVPAGLALVGVALLVLGGGMRILRRS